MTTKPISILEQMARAFQAELRRQGVLYEVGPEEDLSTLMMGTGESADLMPAIKAALQPLLGELPVEVDDVGVETIEASVVVADGALFVHDGTGSKTFHAMIKAILEGGEG